MAKAGRITSIRKFFIRVLSISILSSFLITALFFYIKLSSVLTHQAKEDTDALLGQISQNVQAQVDQINATFPMFVANPVIRAYIEPASAQSAALPFQKKIEIEKQMSYLLINTYLWSEEYIRAVYIFDSVGDTYFVSKTYGGEAELEQNRAASGRVPHSDGSLRIFSSGPGRESIYFVRTIGSMNTGAYVATIVIDVDEGAFSRAYGTDDADTVIALAGADGSRLSYRGDATFADAFFAEALSGGASPQPKQVSLNGKSWFTASRSIPGADLRSCVAISAESVLQGLNQTLASFLPLLLILMASMLLLAILLSTWITRPIQVIMGPIREISSGNMHALIPAGLYREFNELADALNVMLQQIETYYGQIYEGKLLVKNAEIKSLRAQVNPHFLFNVLDTIGWKAQIAGNEEIANMVISLGELLRANVLGGQSDEIRLRDELNYVKFYLYLQKTRFEDKFQTEIRLDGDALLNRMVPRLSVQPLVENAIVHGLESKSGQGRLLISGRLEDGCLILSVEDDGVGFDTALLHVPPDGDESAGRHTHIGLRNLERRIALLYGPGYSLSVTSTPGEGTRAVMTLPQKVEEGGRHV